MKRKTIGVAGAALLALSISTTASAQTIAWKSGVTYANGVGPAVAMNNLGLGWMIEEHTASSCSFYCQSGLWSGAANWSSSYFASASPYESAGSYTNRLAGDAGGTSNLFVEIHNPYGAGDYGQDGLYRTGTLDPYAGVIQWNASRDDGPSNAVQLSIAQGNANGPTTFLAFNSQWTTSGANPKSANGHLYYETGTLNSDGASITWQGSQYVEDGQNPTVAMLVNGNQFFVIQAHEDFSGGLWYRTGTLAPGGSIQWVSITPYDNGSAPTLAICSNPGGAAPAVVEAHQGGPGTLWYRTGYIDMGTSTVTFGNSYPMTVPSYATAPRVACGGHDGVVVYQTGSSSNYTASMTEFTLQ